MIALTLLAAITGILAGGFHLSARAWEAGEERLDGRHEAAEAMNLVKRQLASARKVSYLPPEGDGSSHIAFIGEAESVTFVTSHPRFSSKKEAAGFYIQKIGHDPENGGLIFMEAEFEPSRDIADYEWTTMEMGEKWGGSLKFEYLIKESVEGEGGGTEDVLVWSESVNSEEDLEKNPADKFPLAVRFLPSSPDEPDGFVWPPLTAPIYTGTEIDFSEK